MFHNLHRLRAAFLIALSSILLSVFCESAAATTTVSGTITTNTT
jgi:hypothetical protein